MSISSYWVLPSFFSFVLFSNYFRSSDLFRFYSCSCIFDNCLLFNSKNGCSDDINANVVPKAGNNCMINIGYQMNEKNINVKDIKMIKYQYDLIVHYF